MLVYVGDEEGEGERVVNVWVRDADGLWDGVGVRKRDGVGPVPEMESDALLEGEGLRCAEREGVSLAERVRDDREGLKDRDGEGLLEPEAVRECVGVWMRESVAVCVGPEPDAEADGVAVENVAVMDSLEVGGDGVRNGDRDRVKLVPVYDRERVDEQDTERLGLRSEVGDGPVAVGVGVRRTVCVTDRVRDNVRVAVRRFVREGGVTVMVRVGEAVLVKLVVPVRLEAVALGDPGLQERVPVVVRLSVKVMESLQETEWETEWVPEYVPDKGNEGEGDPVSVPVWRRPGVPENVSERERERYHVGDGLEVADGEALRVEAVAVRLTVPEPVGVGVYGGVREGDTDPGDGVGLRLGLGGVGVRLPVDVGVALGGEQEEEKVVVRLSVGVGDGAQEREAEAEREAVRDERVGLGEGLKDREGGVGVAVSTPLRDSVDRVGEAERVRVREVPVSDPPVGVAVCESESDRSAVEEGVVVRVAVGGDRDGENVAVFESDGVKLAVPVGPVTVYEMLIEELHVEVGVSVAAKVTEGEGVKVGVGSDGVDVTVNVCVDRVKVHVAVSEGVGDGRVGVGVGVPTGVGEGVQENEPEGLPLPDGLALGLGLTSFVRVGDGGEGESVALGVRVPVPEGLGVNGAVREGADSEGEGEM